jgi:hypothetical protein
VCTINFLFNKCYLLALVGDNVFNVKFLDDGLQGRIRVDGSKSWQLAYEESLTPKSRKKGKEPASWFKM